MTLSDLTDPAAVIRAIREADELGRDAFLQKYGFGRAREYFLEYEGKLYDSKAIVGAAHGHQHPTVGPLRAHDFSAGEQSVQRRLEGLGFRVITTMSDDFLHDALERALAEYKQARKSLLGDPSG